MNAGLPLTESTFTVKKIKLDINKRIFKDKDYQKKNKNPND